MSLDLINELSKEISKKVAEAFDQGSLVMLETVITLANINGGRITAKELEQFKSYAKTMLNRKIMQTGPLPEGITHAEFHQSRGRGRDGDDQHDDHANADGDRRSEDSSTQSGNPRSGFYFPIGERDGFEHSSRLESGC